MLGTSDKFQFAFAQGHIPVIVKRQGQIILVNKCSPLHSRYVREDMINRKQDLVSPVYP